MTPFLLILASAAFTTYVEGNQPNATCSKPGLMCKNCDELAVCISDVVGNLKQWSLTKCVGGSCRNGACMPNVKCNYRPFSCSETGSFPDPYDCTLKHLCDGTSSTPQTIQCKNSQTGQISAYNSTYNSCDYLIEGNEVCETAPVPACQYDLQIGQSTNNGNIYYICTEDSTSLGASLFKCPQPGTNFNSSTFVCN